MEKTLTRWKLYKDVQMLLSRLGWPVILDAIERVQPFNAFASLFEIEKAEQSVLLSAEIDVDLHSSKLHRMQAFRKWRTLKRIRASGARWSN
jgi:hypothetical protein